MKYQCNSERVNRYFYWCIYKYIYILIDYLKIINKIPRHLNMISISKIILSVKYWITEGLRKNIFYKNLESERKLF